MIMLIFYLPCLSIREDDMPGLREYFNNNIVSMKDNLHKILLKLMVQIS